MSAMDREIKRRCRCGMLIVTKYDQDGRAKDFNPNATVHQCENKRGSHVGTQHMGTKVPNLQTK